MLQLPRISKHLCASARAHVGMCAPMACLLQSHALWTKRCAGSAEGCRHDSCHMRRARNKNGGPAAWRCFRVCALLTLEAQHRAERMGRLGVIKSVLHLHEAPARVVPLALSERNFPPYNIAPHHCHCSNHCFLEMCCNAISVPSSSKSSIVKSSTTSRKKHAGDADAKPKPPPRITHPMFNGWKPSTSLWGSRCSITASSLKCLGSGSCATHKIVGKRWRTWGPCGGAGVMKVHMCMCEHAREGSMRGRALRTGQAGMRKDMHLRQHVRMSEHACQPAKHT